VDKEKTAYLGLARKFRPQTFEEVVGQQHITSTLKNAILKEKTVPAYLFYGPRGTGKTTTARIFAKCLTCESSEKPTITPCNKCSTCMEVSEGRSLDVIEIDGASNRRIEDIRDLREKVHFAPARSKYKIYIIDEVHMLTPEAFNALLKTLEEPPSHVRFIFATTSPYKIPATILSRCQRFNFKNLTLLQIVEKLKNIASIEKIDVEEKCYYEIAKAGGGAMRDAQVILDQMISYGKERVTLETIEQVLGIIDVNIIIQTSQNLIDRKAEPIIQTVKNILDEGKDLNQFLSQLVHHFRIVLILQHLQDTMWDDAFDVDPQQLDVCREQSKKVSFEELYYILEVLLSAQAMQKTGMIRLHTEMAMIRITERGNIIPLPEVLKYIESNSIRLQNSETVQQITEDLPLVNKSQQEEHPHNQSEKLSQWQTILNEIGKEIPSAAAFLSKSKTVNLPNGSFAIEIPGGPEATFAKQNLERPEINKKIQDIVHRITGKGQKVLFTTNQTKNEKVSVVEDPIVREFQNVFKGNIRIRHDTL
jgi:DNA polymerase-3 subunit gamma/tau